MNEIEKLTLIQGTFSHDEAKEILSNIISYKINFHKIQNWSSGERLGKAHETAQIRIPVLLKEMEKLQVILSEAKAANKKLVVNADIYISQSDN